MDEMRKIRTALFLLFNAFVFIVIASVDRGGTSYLFL